MPIGRQGAARRLSREYVVFLTAVLLLQDRLGLSAGAAATLLPAPGAIPPEHVITLGPITVIVDFAALSTDVTRRLAAAVEMAPRPRRGRPPLRT